MAAVFGTSFRAMPNIDETDHVLVCTSARAAESRDFVSQSDSRTCPLRSYSAIRQAVVVVFVDDGAALPSADRQPV